MRARERVFIVGGADLLTDETAQTGGILLHVVGFFRPPVGFRRAFALCAERENRGDIAALKPALAGEEFQPVAIPWVVARRELHRAVAGEIHRRHEHGGGGAEAAVAHGHPGGGQCGYDRIPQTGTRQAAVPPDRNGQLLCRSAEPVGKPDGKRRRHLFDGFVGEIDRFSLCFTSNAADIGSAFKMIPIHRSVPFCRAAAASSPKSPDK